MYTFFANLARLLLNTFGKVTVENEHLLPAGGYVITCAHRGWLEIVVLGAYGAKPVHFMAKKELFASKIGHYFFTKINAFPVDRDNPSPSSIKIPVQLVKKGHVVGIFPSGTRSAENTSMKRGAVTIANLAKASIVPVVYEGPTSFWEYVRKKRITITYQEPIQIERATKEQLVVYTQLLENILQ